MISAIAFLTIAMATGGNVNMKESRKKARHYFFEAAIKETEGKPDEAYEYYKKAYQTDPEYSDAALAFGNMRMTLMTDSLSTRKEKLRALEITKQFLDKYPGDSEAVIDYGYRAYVMDTLPEAIRVYEAYGKLKPNDMSVLIYKADAYGLMGMTDSAVATIKHIETLNGITAETTLQKVRYHLMEMDTAAIITEMTNLVNANPGKIDYLLMKGKAMEILDFPDSTIIYIRKAEEIDANDGRVKNELANYYLMQGDSNLFDKYTYEALMSENLDLEVKVNILSEYMNSILKDESDTKRSDKLFATLSNQYPHEPVILELGAQYSAAKKDYPAAIEQLNYAIDLDGMNPDYYGSLMTYYLLDDQPSKAMETYERIDKANVILPPSIGVLYASAAEMTEQYDLAVATYDSLLNELAPGVHILDSIADLNKFRDLQWNELYVAGTYYEMAGDMFYKKGDNNQAYICYENALRIFPDNPLALNNYAYFLIEEPEITIDSVVYEKAKKMSRRALDLTDESPVSTYLDTYAWILFKGGDYEDAEEYQKRAMEVMKAEGSDGTYDFFDHYGDILFMNGKLEEAVEQWEKALEMEPDNELIQRKVKDKTYYSK